MMPRLLRTLISQVSKKMSAAAKEPETYGKTE